MKVLMVTQPGDGHLNPMIPAARSLIAAGHELTVVSAARFAPRIRAKGLTAIAAGLDYLESECRTSFPELRGRPDHEVGPWFLGELFADVAVHAMVPDLLDIVDRERPDLLIRTNYEFATCIVGELRRIPHATIHCAFVTAPRFVAEHVEQPLAFARSAWGLAPFPSLAMLDPDLELSQAPLSWHEHAGARLRAVRPAEVTLGDDDPLADAGFEPGRPLVYASLGSVDSGDARLFTTLLDALRDEPINLVVTVGHNHDPARFGPQPRNVLIRSYIPQDLLLPRCDLFINNASFFTVIAAILHGVPVLSCPLAGDTPSGAARFAELGFGLVLRQPGRVSPPLHASVPVFDVEHVRAATRQMLATPQFRARAQRGRTELLALPPWSEAVGWLETLAAKGRASA